MNPEDENKVRNANAKNAAESLLYTVDKLVCVDLKDKIPDEHISSIEDAIKELKDVLDRGWVEIEPKIEELRKSITKMSSDVYGDLIERPRQERF